MIKFRLIQFINIFLWVFRFAIQREAEVNLETFEVIYHPWKLKKLKK